MNGMCDTEPERIVKGRDKAHFNFNIHEIEIEEPDGTTRNVFSYDYVVIEGNITKAKIIKALEDTKLDLVEEWDLDEIESEYVNAKEAITLSNIAGMSYAQLNTYIDNHVTNLAEAKTYLKKLSKVVLAILKYQNIK